MTALRRPVFSLRGLCAGVVVLAACASNNASEQPTPPASAMAPLSPPTVTAPRVHEPDTPAAGLSLPADPGVGAARFEAFRCSVCHAVGGAGERGAPNLGRADLRSGFFEGTARMWNRIPGMSQRMEELKLPWPALSGDDLLNLVALFTTYQYYLTNVGQPGRPEVGERLLQEKGCRDCHAIESDEKLAAPSLKQFGGGKSTMVLAQAMWNHAPDMQRMAEKKQVARPYFREREMADLLAYLATAGKPQGTVTAYVEPGSPARGAERFHSLQCDRCHALRGKGGLQGLHPGEDKPPDLGSDEHMAVGDYTDIAALMWNHGVPMLARMEAEGIARQPLKDTDLADLISFLFFANFIGEAGDPARGREVFESRGCISCHLTQTGAASTGPNLAETRLGGASTPQAVMAAMWRAAPGMRRAMLQRAMEWPILKPTEVHHLVAYLLQVSGNERPGDKPAAAPRGASEEKLDKDAAAAPPSSSDQKNPAVSDKKVGRP